MIKYQYYYTSAQIISTTQTVVAILDIPNTKQSSVKNKQNTPLYIGDVESIIK